MLKLIASCFFLILFSKNFETKSASSTIKPTKNLPCNTTYDCFDFRMICSKNKTCGCAKFHDWEHKTKRCIANISRISEWLKATMSTEPEAVFQQEDFSTVYLGDTKIFRSKWAEYEGVKDTGLGHVTRVIWPILLGSVIILIVYGAILLEFL